MVGLTVAEKTEIAVAATSGAVALATAFLAWKTRVIARATKSAADATRDSAGATRDSADATRVAADATVDEAKAIAKQVAAAEEEIRLTRASLQASIQPWLTIVPPPIKTEAIIPNPGMLYVAPGDDPHLVQIEQRVPNELDITIYLRNVGRGVALIQANDGCVIEGRRLPNNDPETRYGFLSAAALPPGEPTRIGFKVVGTDFNMFLSRHRNDGEFWVNVLYTDVNMEQPVWARVHITRNAGNDEWLFHLIEYTRKGEDEPFAKVVFDAAIFASS